MINLYDPYEKVFVKQCRVDPLINCESEHYMRVQLAHWLKQSKQKKKFFADTLINGNPYRAEVDSETILSICRNFLKISVRMERVTD